MRLFLLNVLAASTLLAAPIDFKNLANGVWSTGLTATATAVSSGGLDPHYILIKNPAGCTGITCEETPGNPFGPSSYIIAGPNGTHPLNGTWLANDAASQWIGPRADQTSPTVGGTIFPNTEIFASNTDYYVYRVIFNLSLFGVSSGSTQIDLRWASDAATGSQIRFCPVVNLLTPCDAGTAVANSASGGPNTLAPVTITSGFTPGQMALDFVIFNPTVASGLNPSGLRVEITSARAGLDSGSAVPEPSTAMLAATALVGLLLYRRRASR